MNNCKYLSDHELITIIGGSSNLFWNRYGIGLAAGSKCEMKGAYLFGKAGHIACGTRAIYAAIRG